MRNKNDMRPTSVTVLAVLGYVLAGVFAISAFIMALLGFPSWNILGIAGLLGVLALASFFVSRGLWNGKNWSRIVVIVGSYLGILTNVMFFVSDSPLFDNSIIGSVIRIILNGVIGTYFLINKDVKKFFRK